MDDNYFNLILSLLSYEEIEGHFLKKIIHINYIADLLI